VVSPEKSPHHRLVDIIRPMGKVLVGYSGGVDSTFLLYSCIQVLGTSAVTAVVVDHPLMREGTVKEAVKIAREMGAEVRTVPLDLLQVAQISGNSPDRCYHCKMIIFGKLAEMARSEELGWVLDGTNADDIDEYRPGLAAIEELGVRSPMKEAALTKSEIREYSRQAELSTWEKPSAPCLATRFPYGTDLVEEEIDRVRQGEKLLIQAGFPDVRLRVHVDGNVEEASITIARIEIPSRDINRLLSSGSLNEIVASLKGLGYRYITLDMEGLRSGSMDDVP
jgi:uncharacterized protein